MLIRTLLKETILLPLLYCTTSLSLSKQANYADFFLKLMIYNRMNNQDRKRKKKGGKGGKGGKHSLAAGSIPVADPKVTERECPNVTILSWNGKMWRLTIVRIYNDIYRTQRICHLDLDLHPNPFFIPQSFSLSHHKITGFNA